MLPFFSSIIFICFSIPPCLFLVSVKKWFSYWDPPYALICISLLFSLHVPLLFFRELRVRTYILLDLFPITWSRADLSHFLLMFWVIAILRLRCPIQRNLWVVLNPFLCLTPHTVKTSFLHISSPHDYRNFSASVEAQKHLNYLQMHVPLVHSCTVTRISSKKIELGYISGSYRSSGFLSAVGWSPNASARPPKDFFTLGCLLGLPGNPHSPQG